MDYRKKIKEERNLIDKVINDPELDGLAIFSCYGEHSARTYVCTDMDTFINMLASAALQSTGMECALRSALEVVEDFRKGKYNNEHNPSLN